MPLLDISEVTSALITVIGSAFQPPTAWNLPMSVPTIYPEPPALLEEPITGMGMYLYHITEDPHYKNLPAPGQDDIPIRFTPMGLNLYYHLSANDIDADDDNRALNEQRMMGIAIKILRDNPEIIVNANGSNNRLRIILNPIPPNEAVSFWTAGNSSLRLSAYYEVSVALLEPEESQRRSARVLSYGVHTFVQGAPKIISSQNIISFTPPGSASPREVTSSPAQVPSGNRFTLSGTGFSGSNVQLQLVNPLLADPVVADAAWLVSINKDTLTATVQQTAISTTSGLPVPIPPGIYATQISVTRQRRLPNGQVRNFTHLSNQCPIAIAPSITAINDTNAVQRIFLISGFTFGGDVRVYIMSTQLEVGTFGALLEGEYAVNPIDDNEIELRLPVSIENQDGTITTLASGDDLPVRIFVNGIESPPRWISIP